MNESPKDLSFSRLVNSIRQIHDQMAAQAGKAVNISLTLRNWAIGFYIQEYEQKGADRAKYGARLLENLSSQLAGTGMDGVATRSLRLYRQFYFTYPQVWQTLSAKSFSDSDAVDSQTEPKVPVQFGIPTTELIRRLSFSHFVELITMDDDFKRTFYEIECVRGNWSVRELKRQISSLYYERSGLSKDKKKLAELVKTGAEYAEPKFAIRDPYIFEFLGLKPKEVMGESALEDRLLDKLQEFLLELGNGFYFEARQKRILIGDTHNFVNLIFYHRILKCHVLVELKLSEFNHENIGQLNTTYVSWYKKNIMTDSDNPPVGILLCTQKDHTLIEYALAGMDNALFVSRYQVELPKKEDMQRFIEEKIKEESI